MKLFNYVLCYFSIIFNMFAFVKVYEKTCNKTIKFDFLNIIVLMILSTFVLISPYLSIDILKIILPFFIVFFSYIFYFKDNLFIIFFKTLIIYVLLSICDFIVSIIYLILNFDPSSVLESVTYLRALNTILDSLLLILIFLFPSIVNGLKKLISYMNRKWSNLFFILAILACIVFLLLTYINVYKLKLKSFIISMLLISFFLILCIVLIIQYFKNKHNEEEQKALLELMKEYEIILDNDRINRHEMLNNLIVLKSFKDKSSKDYEDLLNEIITVYQDKKSKVYSNLYKLPSGFKGIIYYKMAKIKENNIDFNLLSSPNIESDFEKINQKLYYKVCKILGILLDNAIEASSLTEDKHLLIDIYLDEGLIIYVENSFIGGIDINVIHQKGFSSKGNNRGYGLYIVDKLIENNNSLEVSQTISGNKFISILKIKNPSHF